MDRTTSSLRRKKRIRKKRTVRIIIISAIIGLIIFAASAVFKFAKSAIGGNGESVLTGETVSVTVEAGSSTKDIAETLKAAGLIENVTLFRIKSRIGEYDGTYRHGKYLIDKGLSDEDIMLLLQKGVNSADRLVITIPEGYTLKQISEYLETNGICATEEFLNEADSGSFDYGFLSDIPQRENRLEGYLFPDTYYLDKDSGAHAVINKMLARFDEVFDESLREKAASSGFTADEIITMASIIEKEIQVGEERKIASGVIYNRLSEGMPLQMCSTVLYALGKHKVNLTTEDLEVKSPYNTYINPGLPPGPIANPGRAAIEAAVYPDDNEYMYFVLKGAEGGSHVFCKTYDEFLIAKQQYKQSF